MHLGVGDIRPLEGGEEICRAYELETAGYPEDEAASFDIMMYRHREAPELFIGYFHEDELLGFISASRYHGDHMKDEAMKMHIPNGESVCIHSVCVSEEHRRKGIATKLLEYFIDYVRKTQMCVHRILLIAHSHLIPLYTRLGFVFICKSAIKHGKLPWYELEMAFV